MQKNYKLTTGLLVCVLGVGFKAAEAPHLSTSAAATALRGAARNCTVQQNFFDTALSTNPQATIDEERKRIDEERKRIDEEIKRIDEERKRIDAARPRVGSAILKSLCRNFAEVGALKQGPDQVVADGAAQARQAAERMKVGSAGGVELENDRSMIMDLIQNGQKCTIKKDLEGFLKEIEPIERTTYNDAWADARNDTGIFAYIGEHEVYFGGYSTDVFLYNCSIENYRKHIEPSLCSDEIPFKKFHLADVKVVSGIFIKHVFGWVSEAEDYLSIPVSCAILDLSKFETKLSSDLDLKDPGIIQWALRSSCNISEDFMQRPSTKNLFWLFVIPGEDKVYCFHGYNHVGLVEVSGLKMGNPIFGSSGLYQVVRA